MYCLVVGVLFIVILRRDYSLLLPPGLIAPNEELQRLFRRTRG